jgi:hypothetical protein
MDRRSSGQVRFAKRTANEPHSDAWAVKVLAAKVLFQCRSSLFLGGKNFFQCHALSTKGKIHRGKRSYQVDPEP